MVVERIAGRKTQLNYDCIPSVIYTHPEIAWVGANRAATEGGGRALQRRRVSLRRQRPGAGRQRQRTAWSSCWRTPRPTAFSAAISSAPSAADLVQQVVIAMEFGASAEDLALTVFSHPTLSEARARGGAGGGWACHPYRQPQKPQIGYDSRSIIPDNCARFRRPRPRAPFPGGGTPQADRSGSIHRHVRTVIRHESSRISGQAVVCRVRSAGVQGLRRGNPASRPSRPPSKIGGDMWVVKAQVHAGGRGKAGGVKLVKTKDEIRGVREAVAGQATGDLPDRRERASR